MIETLPNFIDGSWRTSGAAAMLNVPAASVMAKLGVTGASVMR